MKEWVNVILRALWFEAIWCTKDQQFTNSETTYVISDIVQIEELVISFEESQRHEDLEELYDKIYNIQDKVNQYKAGLSISFIDSLCKHISFLLPNPL